MLGIRPRRRSDVGMTQIVETPETAPPSNPDQKPGRFEGLGFILAGLAFAMVLRIVVFEPYTIPSRSMEPGLVVGDYVVATKFPYGWSRASLPFTTPGGEGRWLERQARRGDVVIFRRPHNPNEVWIKRVIGLPGDRVQVRSGVVFVNGQPLTRTAAGMAADQGGPGGQARLVRERSPEGETWPTFDRGPHGGGDDTPVIEVPQGRYLVMGDHRDNSLDGRFAPELGVGLLPASHLVGRAEFVLASWNPGAGLFKPWTWLDLRWGRFFRLVD